MVTWGPAAREAAAATNSSTGKRDEERTQRADYQAGAADLVRDGTEGIHVRILPMHTLTLCASLRSGSFNRMFLHQAIEILGPLGEVESLELKDFPMPLYDGDIEASAGVPENGQRLRDRIAVADSLVIGSPEYNNSIPGGLKNAIDWVSRLPRQPFKGKPVMLMGASPGPFGAVRSQMAIRQVLAALAALVVPITVALPHADQAFDEKGALKDPKVRATVERACGDLLRLAAALKAST
jgi:NAD(P)H-dependent FMN reductase